MLYIFLMDTGNMLTFDINLTMDSVSNLQAAIAADHKIAEDKQVLLISGGEHLDPNQRVCSYSSGTDTNPIFLFSKSTIESSVPPSISESIVSDSEMRDQVEGALNMPPSYETVVTRAQLALQFHEVAREELKTCEQLVHDQHLQHQGWAAAVANLEDISMSFTNRTEIFKQSFKEFLNSRTGYLEVLSSFHLTLDLLSRMPLLPCLTTDGGEWVTKSDNPKSLLNWITSQDSRNSLEQMAETCGKGIEQFDEHVMETLLSEVQSVVESVNNPSMKEVKGLEDRLSKLEQLMFSARRLLGEQGEMSQGFIQNQNRASNVRDNSIFPDLCASHKQQLKVMLQNHQNLILARGKCAKAKEELCYNLHQRLRWIMYVEKNLYDVDGKLVIHHENLKRLKRKLEVLQHVHNAPKVYSKIVTEICRRRNFCEKFTEWAASLAEDSSHLYKEEIARRAAVVEFVGHHFFKALFPGIHDQPPPFATEPPGVFDSNLPQVTAEDIETLQKSLPELADFLRVPEPFVIANHFSSVTLRGTDSMRLDQSTSDIEVINHPDEMSPRREVRSQLIKDVIDGAKKDDEMVQSDVEILDMESDTFGTPPDTRVPSRLGASKEPGVKKSAELQTPVKKSTSDVKVTEQSKDIVISGQALSTSPCLSPHDETSDEFTTAVFYIDESMPSSMTESPPIKYRVAELQQMVHEKTAQLEASENTAHVYKDKLDKVEVKFKSLYSLAEKEMLKIKCDLLGTEKILQKEKEEFSEYIDTITKSILSAMNKVEAEQAKIHQQEFNQLRNELETQLKDKEEKCVEQSATMKMLEADLEQYREQITKVNEELDEQKEKMESVVLELKEGFEAEKDAIMKSLTLEHEVEVEKVRAEFEKEIGDKDEKLSNLDIVVSEKSSSLEKISKELECLKEELMEKFQKEKDEIVKIMEKDNAEKMAAMVADVTERLEQTHGSEIEVLKKEHEKKLADACEEIQETLKKEFEIRCNDIRSDLEKEHNKLVEKIRQELESAKLKDLDELRAGLMKERADEVEGLKCDISEVQQEMKRMQDCTVSEEEVVKWKADAERDKELAVKEALDKLVKEHTATIDTLIQQHEKDKQDSLNSMKTSMVADKQVVFNEALSKVVAEKDKVIDDLMKREQSLMALQEKDREMIQMLMSERDEDKASTLGSREQQHEAKGTPQTLEDDLAKAQSDIERLQVSSGGMTLSTMGQSSMGLSVVPIRESMSLTDTDTCFTVSRIEELETIIRDKDEEIGKLQTKMMELSMTQSTRFLMQHDKVSITTCHVGDLVLLCLDERHDHYVVFTVGTTLHFLHSDCLDTLNLKIFPGENRKSWVLAEVTEKEYCQAKKPQNRFKVPVGTKFYRVKAKPWDREAALKKDSASASVK
ncbi:RB1-inducible coiled-coil protein 1-like [Lineus longissimus]|uniref:RB1-inducible coiled-coil protein 1-like n=1 Tax=Lineus longissimus TaxID=88925 RepID=UPI002B4D8D0C